MKIFVELNFLNSVSEFASITNFESANLIDLHLQIDFLSIRLFCAIKKLLRKYFSYRATFPKALPIRPSFFFATLSIACITII